MALTTSGVTQAREIYSKITFEENKLTDLKEILNFMNTDAEFSKFISGTDFGRDYYEKWGNLLSLISGDLYQAMANMDWATQKFLEQQQSYNNGNIGVSRNFGGSSEPVYTTPGFRGSSISPTYLK